MNATESIVGEFMVYQDGIAVANCASRLGSTCRVCGLKAKVKATEKLPDGFAMEATHADGTLHKWVKYYSLDSVGRRKTGKPEILICPKCGKMGRVN
jgi:hypothetical protein